MGTGILQVGSSPNPVPGPTLSRLKGSLRTHSKIVAGPDGSPCPAGVPPYILLFSLPRLCLVLSALPFGSHWALPQSQPHSLF